MTVNRLKKEIIEPLVTSINQSDFHIPKQFRVKGMKYGKNLKLETEFLALNQILGLVKVLRLSTEQRDYVFKRVLEIDKKLKQE